MATRYGFSLVLALVVPGLRAFGDGERATTGAALPLERPRLIVRKEDLPRLRARAQTAEGRKLVAQMAERIGRDDKHTANDDAVAQAMLHVLGGQEQHFAPTRKAIEAWMADPAAGHETPGKAIAACLAYDLIFDACEPEFRTKVNGFVEANLERVRDMRDRPGNWADASNFNGRWRPALGVMALTILEEPGCDHGKVGEMLAFAEKKVTAWTATALGESGWNSEGDHYTDWCLKNVLPFLHAYRNVTGRDLPGSSHVAMYLPLCVARTVTGKDGIYVPELGVGKAGLYFHRDLLAMGFSAVPPVHKPTVLWHWERVRAMDDDGVGVLSSLSAGSAAYELVNCPLDVAGQAGGIKPANPEGSLPHLLVDQQKGAYLFRNRWKDGDDILAVFLAKHSPDVGGWSSAENGVFRIYGLGRPWVVRGPGCKVGHWHTDNVVLDPDMPPAVPKGKRLGTPTTYFRSAKDGSGVVSVQMGQVYGKGAVRSFAADYSGACGAAALFAVADDVGSGGQKTWQMWVAGDVAVEGNAFTVRHKGTDGTLRGTFVLPADVRVKTVPAKGFITINPTDREAKVLNVPVEGMTMLENRSRPVNCAIQATGGDMFFIVMTLQEGGVPVVAISRTGTQAKATIGSRTLSFEEGRINGITDGSRPSAATSQPTGSG